MPPAAALADRDSQSLVLVACCRPDGSDRDDKVLRPTLRRLQWDENMRAIFRAQAELDSFLAAGVQALPLPQDLVERAEARFLEASRESHRWRSVLRHPALLCALLAIAFLMGWSTLLIVEHINGFHGDDAVAKIITAGLPPVPSPQGASREVARRNWLEPVGGECGQLGDMLFLAHGFDQFRIPAGFAHYQATGFRVYPGDDAPVAKVVVQPHDLVFFTFRADRKGVRIKPAGSWKFLTGDDWAAAVQVDDGICFVAACHGAKSDIKGYLREAGIAF